MGLHYPKNFNVILGSLTGALFPASLNPKPRINLEIIVTFPNT